MHSLCTWTQNDFTKITEKKFENNEKSVQAINFYTISLFFLEWTSASRYYEKCTESCQQNANWIFDINFLKFKLNF